MKINKRFTITIYFSSPAILLSPKKEILAVYRINFVMPVVANGKTFLYLFKSR